MRRRDSDSKNHCCRRWSRFVGLALLAAIAIVLPSPAWALIRGGTDNLRMAPPDWPAGAAEVFNSPARVAYWEGPPYGGGEWHSECRGDAQALNKVLADFAKLDAKNRRIIVHDGVGRSFWLSSAEKKSDARIDWSLTVWQLNNWQRQQKLPPDLRGPVAEGESDSPPVRLDLYVGGNIRWEDVKIPEGIEVDDQRLAAHGFQLTDGVVFEGELRDGPTGKAIVGTARLERVEPLKEGGYRHVRVAEVKSDENGKWVLKNSPAGWHRLVATAAGHVSRVVGYVSKVDEPSWQQFSCVLSPAAAVAGQVTDSDGKPLADVDVRLADVTTGKGGTYESDTEFLVKSDAEGRFRFANVPAGTARVRVHKPGYCNPGLGLPITTPMENIGLKMQKAAQLNVKVAFAAGTRPGGYIVHIAPEEGEAVGRWSGSGNIDVEDRITFSNVPPGRYVVYGRPNPGSDDQQTKSFTVDLKGGESTQLKIDAK